jgi:hypothetical protein
MTCIISVLFGDQRENRNKIGRNSRNSIRREPKVSEASTKITAKRTAAETAATISITASVTSTKAKAAT